MQIDIFRKLKYLDSLRAAIERHEDRLQDVKTCTACKEWTSIEEDCCGVFHVLKEELEIEIKSFENEIEGMLK
jgi:hypothetical protein